MQRFDKTLVFGSIAPQTPTPTSTLALLRNILLGTGGVQELDGQSHTWRKQLLASLFETRWAGAVRDMSPDQTFEFLPWSEASTG